MQQLQHPSIDRDLVLLIDDAQQELQLVREHDQEVALPVQARRLCLILRVQLILLRQPSQQYLNSQVFDAEFSRWLHLQLFRWQNYRVEFAMHKSRDLRYTTAMFVTQMQLNHGDEPNLPDARAVEVVDEPHAINLVLAISLPRCLQGGAQLSLYACGVSTHLMLLQ